MSATLGTAFQPNLNEFPVDLSGINLPLDWEETKWKHTVTIQSEGGLPHSVTIEELVHQYTMGMASVVNIQSINETNGRQLFFGLNPESRTGNEFTGWLYRERGGGGATIVAYSVLENGTILIALLDQDRPLLFQQGQVKQVIGGYPTKMVGTATADQVHSATFREELDELAKFSVVPGTVEEIGARYNTNKAMSLTGIGEGISVQLLEIPCEILTQREDGATWRLNTDKVDVNSDRTLEGIAREVFYVLNSDLIREVTKPCSGASSCAHTELAVRRSYDILVNGWTL